MRTLDFDFYLTHSSKFVLIVFFQNRHTSFCTTVLWLIACQKDDPAFRSEGQVVGYDLRLCACCGGWFLEIEGETYRADLSAEDVERLNLETPALPVLVRLDWKLKDNPCLGDEIIVTKIERR